MKDILINTTKSEELKRLGYTRFQLLNEESINTLIQFYLQFKTDVPNRFYATSHSENIEFRLRCSEWIKQTVEKNCSAFLKDYRILGGAFLIKPAHTTSALEPHQDWNLVNEEKDRSFNLWIPLQDVNEENGTIYILPKSHTRIQTFRGPQIPSPFLKIEKQIWPYLTPLKMKAGEALLYDHALIHGSGPNQTQKERLGIVLGVIPKQTQMQLLGLKEDCITRFECDENYFLKENIETDYLKLKEKSRVTSIIQQFSLQEFLNLYTDQAQEPGVNKLVVEPAKRSFFETYTLKNVLAELRYRLTKKDTNAVLQSKETINQVNSTGKNVAQFYNEQTGNFLKVYGNVIQAFRTKNISTLLDYQINAIGLNSATKALDAGCGVCGPAVYFGRKLNCQIDAITISSEQVELAKTNIQEAGLSNCIKVIEGDYHTLENYYPNNTFDVVYFLESFGHASNHEQVLHSVWQVLKPGGSVYIKDLFIKKAPYKSMESGIERELQNINTAYHYNVPDLNAILDIVRKKGFILSSLKTIDIPLEEFENLTISNDFQNLTGINKIDNLREYVFPVDFFELKLMKPNYNSNQGNSRYFLQNMYLMQIENWKEKDL